MKRYKTATYISDDRGKSLRALDAEESFRFPKSKCWPEVRDFAKALGKTKRSYLRKLKIVVEKFIARGTNEWHHTGLYARYTDYYYMSKII